MDKKAERLCRAIKRAGILASKKQGHILTREELLQVKVQVLPVWVRVILGAAGIWCGFKACTFFTLGLIGNVLLLGVAALLLLCFAIWGFRKTCRRALRGMDDAATSDLLEIAVEGIGHAVGALFDGL